MIHAGYYCSDHEKKDAGYVFSIMSLPLCLIDFLANLVMQIHEVPNKFDNSK